MLDPCGLTMTRSALNRPAERISLSSSSISCRTLVNTGRTPHDRCSLWSPVKDHFAATAAAHRRKRFLEVGRVKPVRDDRGNVKARLDQHRHLVPGFEHLPAVDAFDRDHVSDEMRP